MSQGSDFPIILVKGIPYDASTKDLYELFGAYGNILQIRKGTENETRGTCIVVYNNVKDAHSAHKKLNGYNFNGRYMVVLMYNVDKTKIREEDLVHRKEQLEKIKQEYGIE